MRKCFRNITRENDESRNDRALEGSGSHKSLMNSGDDKRCDRNDERRDCNPNSPFREAVRTFCTRRCLSCFVELQLLERDVAVNRVLRKINRDASTMRVGFLTHQDLQLLTPPLRAAIISGGESLSQK
jgi:hypothetical protein